MRWSELEPEIWRCTRSWPAGAGSLRLYRCSRSRDDAPCSTTCRTPNPRPARRRAGRARSNAAAAVEEYQTAIRLESRQPDWHASLAALLIQLERKDEAKKAVAALRELDPEHQQLAELEKSLAP